jgi:tryptophan synthase alpha chain
MKGIYIMGGYPSREGFRECFKEALTAGFDFIEAGIPFNDPTADGPVISRAGSEAIAAGITPAMVMDDIAQFRGSPVKKYVMTYANIIHAYGPAKFSSEARGLLDGVIIADVPNRMAAVMREAGLTVPIVPFATLETRESDIDLINGSEADILYFVGLRGITGAKGDFSSDEITAKVDFLKKRVSKKIVIGFGIKTAADAGEALSLGDGFVVGTEAVARQKDIIEYRRYMRELLE